MTIRIDQLEQIVRRYLATGTAVVVVVLAPGTGAPAATDTGPASAATTTVTVVPGPPAPLRSGSTGPPQETKPSTTPGRVASERAPVILDHVGPPEHPRLDHARGTRR